MVSKKRVANKIYNNILRKCKFVSKGNEWFIEGTEAKLVDESYQEFKISDKFKNGWGLFQGKTNETFKGYSGELPRMDEKTCSFDEFYIYDENGFEISELTFEEYLQLLEEKKKLREKFYKGYFKF
jgi:hypothetical protein